MFTCLFIYELKECNQHKEFMTDLLLCYENMKQKNMKKKLINS